MKLYFFILASLFFAVLAQASDSKIGNVIAVEREVSDIYATCLKNSLDDTRNPQNFFSCSIKYTTENEIPISKGRVISLADDKCSVRGEATNGIILITFAGTKSPSTFETSRACLQRALANQDGVKVTVYTIE